MTEIHNPLISVAELNAVLSAPELRIIDCRFRLTEPNWGQMMYRREHVPGAVYAHLDHDLASPVSADSGRHPLPGKNEFLRLLARWGADADGRFICYDSAGGAVAVRLWWMLRHWLGLGSVQILDGGWPAWQQAGCRVETGDAVIRPAAALLTCKADLGCWLSTDQIVANLESQEYCLVDARSSKRFAGLEEPIDTVAGHIPEALNRPLTDNLTKQGLFKPAMQLRQEFAALLPTDCSPENVVHSCGSGVTACHNLFAMELADMTGSRLYPGSWSEWIRDPKRPMVTGAGK